jgi:hypothetical protein
LERENFKLDLGKLGCGDVNWCELTWDGEQWWDSDDGVLVLNELCFWTYPSSGVSITNKIEELKI